MLEPGQCAAGAGSGQPSAEDFGLDIFGVGDAATTGIGLSGKLAKLALSDEEVGMYCLSLPTIGERQKWLKTLLCVPTLVWNSTLSQLCCCRCTCCIKPDT